MWSRGERGQKGTVAKGAGAGPGCGGSHSEEVTRYAEEVRRGRKILLWDRYLVSFMCVTVRHSSDVDSNGLVGMTVMHNLAGISNKKIAYVYPHSMQKYLRIQPHNHMRHLRLCPIGHLVREYGSPFNHPWPRDTHPSSDRWLRRVPQQ